MIILDSKDGSFGVLGITPGLTSEAEDESTLYVVFGRFPRVGLGLVLARCKTPVDWLSKRYQYQIKFVITLVQMLYSFYSFSFRNVNDPI